MREIVDELRDRRARREEEFERARAYAAGRRVLAFENTNAVARHAAHADRRVRPGHRPRRGDRGARRGHASSEVAEVARGISEALLGRLRRPARRSTSSLVSACGLPLARRPSATMLRCVTDDGAQPPRARALRARVVGPLAARARAARRRARGRPARRRPQRERGPEYVIVLVSEHFDGVPWLERVYVRPARCGTPTRWARRPTSTATRRPSSSASASTLPRRARGGRARASSCCPSRRSSKRLRATDACLEQRRARRGVPARRAPRRPGTSRRCRGTGRAAASVRREARQRAEDDLVERGRSRRRRRRRRGSGCAPRGRPGRDVAGEDAVAEAGREALDLRLDALDVALGLARPVDPAAARACRPRRCACPPARASGRRPTAGRASRNGRSGEAAGGLAASASRSSCSPPPTWTVPALARRRRRPRDRAVQRPVDLDRRRARSGSGAARRGTGRERVAGQREQRVRHDVGDDERRRRSARRRRARRRDAAALGARSAPTRAPVRTSPPSARR